MVVIHRFERGSVLIGVAVRRDERSMAKETVNSVEPGLVACVDFSWGKIVLAAEDVCFEAPDHVVAGGDSGSG